MACVFIEFGDARLKRRRAGFLIHNNGPAGALLLLRTALFAVTRRSLPSLLKTPAGLLTYRMLLIYGCIRGVSVPSGLYTVVHTAAWCELVTR
jgi:hypothetical protein